RAVPRTSCRRGGADTRALVRAARPEQAPAKVNLTLRVLGRRADGYHEIESLVAFAGVGDALAFTPGRALALTVIGPTASAAGDVADNLVLKAARALAERVPGLKLGRLALSKRLPVAAGLGGGSADAAAARRLPRPPGRGSPPALGSAGDRRRRAGLPRSKDAPDVRHRRYSVRPDRSAAACRGPGQSRGRRADEGRVCEIEARARPPADA